MTTPIIPEAIEAKLKEASFNANDSFSPERRVILLEDAREILQEALEEQLQSINLGVYKRLGGWRKWESDIELASTDNKIDKDDAMIIMRETLKEALGAEEKKECKQKPENCLDSEDECKQSPALSKMETPAPVAGNEGSNPICPNCGNMCSRILKNGKCSNCWDSVAGDWREEFREFIKWNGNTIQGGISPMLLEKFIGNLLAAQAKKHEEEMEKFKAQTRKYLLS